MNCLTMPEHGIVDKTNKIIFVSQRPKGEHALIKEFPGYEVKYKFYSLHPDFFTEEEEVQFQEHWRLELNKKKQALKNERWLGSL